MRTWIARPLRRFLATAVMLAGGMAFIHGLLFPRPAFPSARADRVTVWVDGFTREIRNPEQVRRIVALIRARRDGEWRRMPEFVQHFSHARSLFFYRGNRKAGEATWAPNVLSVPAGQRWYGWFDLTPRECTELERLLGI